VDAARERAASEHIPLEKALIDVLGSSPPRSVEEMSTSGRQLKDAAEAYLSGDIVGAQQRVSGMSQPMQDAFFYMVSESSGYRVSDVAGRMGVAEQLGSGIELGRTPVEGPSGRVSMERLTDLSQAAYQSVYGNDNGALAREFARLSPSEARAMFFMWGEMFTAREEGLGRASPQSYARAFDARQTIQPPAPSTPVEQPARTLDPAAEAQVSADAQSLFEAYEAINRPGARPPAMGAPPGFTRMALYVGQYGVEARAAARLAV
jgi:hypothetical protein